MNAPTNIQVINGPDGKPAYVVIPYGEYMSERNADRGLIPHDVVSRTVDGASVVRAWREHLGLTQAQIADRLGVSQSAYAQQEVNDRLRKSSRDKIAVALGLTAQQLNF